MFIIAFRPSAAPEPVGIAALTSRVERINAAWNCCVYYDTGQVALSESNGKVTLSHKRINDGEIFSLNRLNGEALIRKPFMLGLPVYYSKAGQDWMVSSHIRWMKDMGMPLQENEAGLPELFVYRYLTAPQTMFKDIYTLPLGGSLLIRLREDGTCTQSLSWPDLFETPVHSRPTDEVVDLIREDLRTSLRFLAPSGGRITCLMSGGVDSSIVFKMASDTLSVRETQASGYPFEDEITNDEKHYAETAAAALGCSHTYHQFSMQEYLSSLIQAVVHGEVTTNHLQTTLFDLMFSRGLRSKFDIVISGLGADAAFGLPIMLNYHRYRLLLHPTLAPLSHRAAGLVGKARTLELYSKYTWDNHYENPRHGLWLMGEYGDKQWVKEHFNARDEALFASRLHAVTQFKTRSVLDAFSILDTVTSVAYSQDLWGKLAHAYGLYMYYPFNSPAMLEPVYALPWNAKLSEPKRYLRKVGQAIGIPDFILMRPKRGFGVNPQRWAQPGGAFEPLVRLAAPVVGESTLRKFQNPEIHAAMTFWNLINYALWKRIWINGEPPELLQEELIASTIR